MTVTLKLDTIQFPPTYNFAYSEGVWTPIDGSGAGLVFTGATGFYEKIGRQVCARCALDYPSTANGANAKIGGLPFAIANTTGAGQGFITYVNETTLFRLIPNAGLTTVSLFSSAGTYIVNATMSTDTLHFCVIYNV